MEKEKDIITEIGLICKSYRESIGHYQFEVAQDTGYSSLNVSSFENGRNNNMLLLLWYIKKGLPVSELPDPKRK